MIRQIGWAAASAVVSYTVTVPVVALLGVGVLYVPLITTAGGAEDYLLADPRSAPTVCAAAVLFAWLAARLRAWRPAAGTGFALGCVAALISVVTTVVWFVRAQAPASLPVGERQALESYAVAAVVAIGIGAYVFSVSNKLWASRATAASE